MSFLQVAESVTEGHPDKIADQISDSIVDAILERDQNARVACETLISNGFCVISGEIRTEAYVPITEIARETLREIGYTDANSGFDYRSAGILQAIGEQSPDIAMGVDRADGVLGAGDQGIMVGFATDETDEFMPLPIMLAHKLTKRLAEVRKDGSLPFLYPDGKAQVVVRYEEGKPVAVDQVAVSAHHAREVTNAILQESIIDEVIRVALPKELISSDPIFHINPTGLFITGGPQADTGLTGRKSVIDSYGPIVAHGGGSFSGKDPSKMDRCGAYMARYIAKNMVASGVAKKLKVELAYVIGLSTPISVRAMSFGTSSVADELITKAIREIFDLTPRGIIDELNLLKPLYKKTASYGHFGRENEDFGWEKLSKVALIKNYFKL